MLRRINLSSAFIVLVCFFLPWVQVSCAGARDTLTGLDLARHDESLLWLIPLAMCALLVFGLLRLRRPSPQLQGMLSTFCGLVVVFLMNRERARAQYESGLVAAQLTGWFWLGLIAGVAIMATAIALLLKQPRSSGNPKLAQPGSP